MLFQNLQEEEAEALRQEAQSIRATSTADSFTQSMFANLEQNYQANPQLPPDAQVALALDPASQSMFANFSMAYANTPQEPATGQSINPALAQRYLNASPERQDEINNIYGAAAARISNGPASRFQRVLGGTANALDGPAGLVQSTASAIPGNDQIYTALKGATRYAMPALDSGQQLIQAKGRQYYTGLAGVASGDFSDADDLFLGATPLALGRGQLEQTDLAQQARTVGDGLGQLVTGEDVTAFDDIGDGFFVNDDSEWVARRREAERAMGTLTLSRQQNVVNEVARQRGIEVLPGGQTITIGRAIAHTAGLDPDSTSYNVLSGIADGVVAVAAPGPESAAAAQLRLLRRPGARLFGAVSEMEYMANLGAFRGARTQVDLARAEEFIRGDEISGFVDFLKGSDSFARIDEATNGALNPETVAALADASDSTSVRDLLMQAVNHGERPTFRTGGQRARDRVGQAMATGGRVGLVRRLAGEVPGGTIDLRDGRQAVDTIRDYARNVNVRGELADEWVNAMGRATNNVSRRGVYARILTETADDLVDGGLHPERARAITKYARDELDTIRAALDDVIDMDASRWSEGLVETEFGVRIPGATVLAEMAESLPLPDARQIRRATSDLNRIWEAGLGPDAGRIEAVLGAGWRGSATALSGFSRLFKDTRLLRLGYPLRVIPEEQLRRIADGTHRFISHPLALFGSMADPRVGEPEEMVSGWRRLLDRETLDAADLPTPLAADRIADDLQLPAPDSGILDFDGELLTDADRYEAAMADSRLGGIREDGLSAHRGKLERFVLRDAEGAIHEDALAVWRDNLITLSSDPVISRLSRNGVDNTLAELSTTSTGLRIREKLVAYDSRLADDDMLRRYLESQSERIQAMTGGHDDLMQLIQRGGKPNLSLLREIGPEFAPTAVIGRGLVSGDQANLYTRMTNIVFENLATRPTNSLSRSPVFLEKYEQNLLELAPLAENPEEFLAAARKANVRESTMSTLRETATGGGQLNITIIDAMAKKGALDHVQGLLYDVGRTSQFFDQARVLFPFGEAWKEVITTWAKLISEDPFTVARRAGQTAGVLESNDFGQTYFDLAGLDQEADSGFFYENDFGDQVFYYPWSAQINEATSGMPWRMEASARSLNIAGEMLPGLGPVGQVAIHHLLPNNTDYDAIREKLFPYGPPSDLRNVSGWALPNWANTLVNRSIDGGFTQEQERLYGNTQWRVATYLYSKNPERYQGPNGAQLLEDDSRPITRNLFLTRSMAQAVAPAAPLITANLVGANGELIDQSVVADAYRSLQEQDYETALEGLIALYGEGSVLATQGNTAATVHGGTPFDGAGYDWVRDNPDVATEHPELYGFFAPTGDGSDFSSEAYRRSLDNGERVQLTLKQKFKLAQHRQASAIYAQYLRQVDGTPSDEERAILNSIRQELREMFPGYQRIDDVVERTDVWRVVEGGDVDRALADPLITGTPAGEALSTYWEFRAEVVGIAEANGLGTVSNGGWRSANAGEPYRDRLREAGEELVAQEPAFARIWDVFLSREFDSDIED